jgi:hypothetical protein
MRTAICKVLDHAESLALDDAQDRKRLESMLVEALT